MPAAIEQFKKLGSTAQVATLTLLPFIVLAFAFPEFCNCASSCASMRGYVIMAAAAWFLACKQIVAKLNPGPNPEAAEGKANACCDSPVAAPPPAPAAKAA